MGCPGSKREARQDRAMESFRSRALEETYPDQTGLGLCFQSLPMGELSGRGYDPFQLFAALLGQTFGKL